MALQYQAVFSMLHSAGRSYGLCHENEKINFGNNKLVKNSRIKEIE